MSSDQHFAGEVGQKALIVRDGKVLMVNAVGEPGWDFPGGRLHKGEDPNTGLLRELEEEIGITSATILGPRYTLLATPRTGEERFMVVYECVLPEDATLSLRENEIREVRWVGVEEVATLETHPAWKSLLEDHWHKNKEPRQ